MPFSELLNRIRKLIPAAHDRHYEEISAGFHDGQLEHQPMSDAELATAIAEFLSRDPSAETMAGLAKRIQAAKNEDL